MCCLLGYFSLISMLRAYRVGCLLHLHLLDLRFISSRIVNLYTAFTFVDIFSLLCKINFYRIDLFSQSCLFRRATLKILLYVLHKSTLLLNTGQSKTKTCLISRTDSFRSIGKYYRTSIGRTKINAVFSNENLRTTSILE